MSTTEAPDRKLIVAIDTWLSETGNIDRSGYSLFCTLRAALAAAAPSPVAEPAAWRYLLAFGDEFAQEVVSRDRFDLTVTSPFGRKGIDFDASGRVEEQPLYATPGAHPAPTSQPSADVMSAVQALLDAHADTRIDFSGWCQRLSLRVEELKAAIAASETAETASVAGLTPKCSNCGSSTAMQCNGMGCFALEGQGEVPAEPSAERALLLWLREGINNLATLSTMYDRKEYGIRLKQKITDYLATPPARDAGLSLTDAEVDEILHNIDSHAREYDLHAYGLPMVSDHGTLLRMRHAIREGLAATQEKRTGEATTDRCEHGIRAPHECRDCSEGGQA